MVRCKVDCSPVQAWIIILFSLSLNFLLTLIRYLYCDVLSNLLGISFSCRPSYIPIQGKKYLCPLECQVHHINHAGIRCIFLYCFVTVLFKQSDTFLEFSFYVVLYRLCSFWDCDGKFGNFDLYLKLKINLSSLGHQLI